MGWSTGRKEGKEQKVLSRNSGTIQSCLHAVWTGTCLKLTLYCVGTRWVLQRLPGWLLQPQLPGHCSPTASASQGSLLHRLSLLGTHFLLGSRSQRVCTLFSLSLVTHLLSSDKLWGPAPSPYLFWEPETPTVGPPVTPGPPTGSFHCREHASSSPRASGAVFLAPDPGATRPDKSFWSTDTFHAN